jgi:hypothetical protein
MGNLILFDKAKVPAYVQKFIETEESNIGDRNTVPSLTYKGKVWAININGEEQKLLRKNEDGDMEPAATTRWIILGFNQRRGRAYYEGAYDPDKPGRPLCWSEDGITPDAAIAEPQAEKCKGCPMSVKGSKITENNKAVVACSEHRMLAVVPANKPEFTPLRLKIAITSDYDGQSPGLEQEGWYAFSNYTQMLRANAVPHTSLLVTKMKFDPNVAYPKVIFSADHWVPETHMAVIKKLIHSDEVAQLLSGTWTPEGADGHKKAETASVAKLDPPAKPAPVAKAAPVAKPTLVTKAPADDGDIVLEGEASDPEPVAKVAPAAPKAAPKAAKAAEPTVTKPVEALLDDWDA